MENLKTLKTVKLFVLGRPGTGKSTAARLMVQLAREHRWHPQHISDYGILHSMYQREEREKEKTGKEARFRNASEYLDGFDVVDPAVFDDALAEMKQQVNTALTRALVRMKLVIIEFARGTYKTSLEQFGSNFLQESYFLFLDSDIDTCMARIKERALHRVFDEDLFISREAMKKLYSVDDIPATRAMLRTVYKLDNSRIKVLHNVSSKEIFLNDVRRFIELLLIKESSS